MIRDPISYRLKLILSLFSVLILIAGYLTLSHRQHAKNPDDTTLPNLSQLKDGVKKVTTPHRRSKEIWLLEDMKATGLRLTIGLLSGLLSGVIIGLVMGCFASVEAFFLFPLSFASKLNPIAMLAVFFVMAGTGTEMYAAMIAFGVMPTFAQTIYLAAKHDVAEELIHKAYTLGASHLEVILNVIFRQIFPRILDAIRLQIGPALVYLIAAEMVVGDVGFGYRIRIEYRLLNMNVVYPYIAILALFGYTADYLIRLMQGKFFPWYGR
jgi:NitT/TauT family transport system permease protein